MLTKSQIIELKNELQKNKAEYEKRINQTEHFDLLRNHAHESVGELSNYDNHPADEGTELYEREKDIALNAHLEYEMEKIEQALEAMNDGTYGKCKICKKELSYERLHALPEALYCIEHTPDRTISQNRPVEEDVLGPPFGKFDMDHKDENVEYDAEDSWQSVARWGTSESPSDFIETKTSYDEMFIESDENIGYVEDFENFVGTDITGKEIKIYPNQQHEKYERELDEEGIMTSFGDLPAYEREPYVEE